MTTLHYLRTALIALACTGLATAQAATALRSGRETNVSQTPAATEKAKLVRLSYADGAVLRKAWLFTYGDGPVDQQNVFARVSFDEGATWSLPTLLSRDASGAPTGGQSITTRDAITLIADNDKPSVFAPPVTSGPKVVIAWNGAYCPADPVSGTAGSYASALQGTGDFDGDGTPERAYHCVWVATSTDPALAAWNVQQLTTAERDAIGEVIAGSTDGRAFAMAWQEDPSGLQPGEAEGRGDGGSGATVSGGTNIWYTHANAPDGSLLRAHITTLSDNLTLGTAQPGASRPNVSLSGTTAVVAYEESACAGGSGGKCIVFHSFAYATPETVSPGTIVSDVTHSARRVRIVLQGAAAAGSSPLRTLLLWRESPIATPAAPADIMIRRGLVDTTARPGSTGYRASDVLADTPQPMTRAAASGGNANAHRAIVRGSFIGLAYDLTSDMQGADPKHTAAPTANYNLHFTRSTADGAPGSWSSPRNLSGIGSPAITVVEPRLVPTPGTIVNPLTGRPDAGDTQDGRIFYVAFATERNALTQDAGRVFASRSTDLGESFEPFVPVSQSTAGQSESQLRPTPDGASATVLWMAEQLPGDPQSKDAAYAVLNANAMPDLALSAADARFDAGAPRTLTLRLSNPGAGPASGVVVDVALPPELTIVGIGDPSVCRVTAPSVQCRLGMLPAGAAVDLSLAVSAAVPGTYTATASVASDWLDADASNDSIAVALAAAEPVVVPPPVGPPPPVADADGGGGCSASSSPGLFDPVWLGLLLFSVSRIVLPRRRHG